MLATQDYTLFDLTETRPVHVLTKKEIIKRNVDLSLRRLVDVEEGGSITYSELAAVCPDADNHGYLRKLAKELAQSEYGVIFQPLSGVALRRIPMDSVSRIASDDAKKRIKSTVKTWERKLDTVDIHRLTTDQSRTDFVKAKTQLFYQQQAEEMRDRQANLAIEKAQEGQSIADPQQVKQLILSAMHQLAHLG